MLLPSWTNLRLLWLCCRQMLFIMVLDQMATTGLLLGERERLFRFYPMLASFRGRIGNSIIDRLLGEIETLQGDFAGAQISLAAAEAIARREDIVWELAFVLAALNLALAVKGEKSTETARALLVEGLDLFNKYGSTPISERVRDRLRALNGLVAAARKRDPPYRQASAFGKPRCYATWPRAEPTADR